MIRVLRAFWLAYRGHRKQRDLAGVPYIRHLVRVAWIAYGLTGKPEAAVVGLLHDLYEDVGWTPRVVRWFGGATDMRVWALTRAHGGGEDYGDYIAQIQRARDPVVAAVKIADLLDNTRPGRLPKCRSYAEESDRQNRINKYLQALTNLLLTRCWQGSESGRYEPTAEADPA